MTMGKMLAQSVSDATDLNVTFFPSYGAEQRGGTANCFVVISDQAIGSPVADKMDEMVVMNQPSMDKFAGILKPGGLLFVNSSIVSQNIPRDRASVVEAPVTEMALELGNAKVLNIIMLGMYIGHTEILSADIIWNTVVHKLANKPQLLALNEQAFQQGLEIGCKARTA